jgi:hypothetical protein
MAIQDFLDDVQKLYIAYYQRPADPSGLRFWAQRLEAAGGSLAGIIDAFATSPEAVSLYDANHNGALDIGDADQLIDAIYQALFNRAPDAAGKNFYLTALQTGYFPDGRLATPGRVALDILNGAQNSDAVAIANKLTVANRFTSAVDGRPLTDPDFGTGTSFDATYAGNADAQAARTFLATVTSNPATVPSQAQVIQEIKTHIANLGDPILNVPSGQTFTLTADAPSVTEGNSGTKTLTFTLTLDKAPTEAVTVNYQTLTTGTATANDDFAPATGTVTFASGQTTATVSVTVNGDTTFEPDETVQVKFSGSKLAADVIATGTITNDDSQNQTFTLTTGADTVQGGAGNDTFVATEATLSSADIIDGGDGTDLFRYASSGNAAVNEAGFEIKNVETVQITSDAWFGTTFDFTGTQGVQTIRNFNSSVSQTLTGLKTLAPTIEIDSIGAQNRGLSIVDTTIVYDVAATKGTADAVQMNLSGNLNTDGSRVGTVRADGIEIFNVKSSGSASAFDELASNSLREMNITGDANLTLAGAVFNNTAAVNTVNAKDFTGKLDITLTNSGAANIDVAVTGGKGDDRADFSAGFDKNDAFDGGDGTDTLALTNGVAVVVNPANFGTVKNVEILEITNSGANIGTSVLDLDNFPGVNTVYYSGLIGGNGLIGATTVQDVASGFTVKVNNPNNQNLTTTIKTDGASDVLSLQVEKLAANEVLKTVTAAKFETVNLDVRDDANVVGVGDLTINQLAINDATTLNITGDAKLTINNDGNPTTPVLTTLNAKDQSGGITLTNVNFAKAGATITFGSGDDTFNVATANGADTITLGAGKDRVVYATVAQSNKNMDTITDFVSGTDVVDVRALMGGIGSASSTQFAGNRPNFWETQGALSHATADAVFQQDAQILWVDVNKDGTLDNTDFRVKLSGVTSLTAADLGFGVGNTINLTAAGALVNLTTNINADNVSTVEDDIINTKTAFLFGSNINGAGGTDVMNITDDLAGANLGGLGGATVTKVEQVNLLQGASVGSIMFDNPTKIVSSAATTLTLGTGGQTYVGSAAVDTITDNTGDDTIETGAGNDTITLANISKDSVDAGDGNDTVNAGTFLTAFDTLIGGAGNDTLNADDPAGGFAATDFDNVSGFETINLKINNLASVITTQNTLVATGANLAVNILGGATKALTFDGTLENDGRFTFTELGPGSAMNHVLTGGAGDDVFNLGLNNGDLNLNGGPGDDTFNLGDNLTVNDTINGGSGFDTVWVGDSTGTTDLNSITNVERIVIVNTAGNPSTYIPADTVIAAGKSITIDASGSGDGVTLDFSNEKDGSFTYKASKNGDTINTAKNHLSDTIILGGGTDTVKITTGANTVADIADVDVIQKFDAGADTIKVPVVGPGTWSITLNSTTAGSFVADVNTALTTLGLPYLFAAAQGDAIILTVYNDSTTVKAGTYVIYDTTAPAFIDNTAEVFRLVDLIGSFSAADFS